MRDVCWNARDMLDEVSEVRINLIPLWQFSSKCFIHRDFSEYDTFAKRGIISFVSYQISCNRIKGVVARPCLPSPITFIHSTKWPETSSDESPTWGQHEAKSPETTLTKQKVLACLVNGSSRRILLCRRASMWNRCVVMIHRCVWACSLCNNQLQSAESVGHIFLQIFRVDVS